MLTGNQQESDDLIYSEPYSHLPIFNRGSFATGNYSDDGSSESNSGDSTGGGAPVQVSSKSAESTKTPKRRLESRKAFKETLTKHASLDSNDDKEVIQTSRPGISRMCSMPAMENVREMPEEREKDEVFSTSTEHPENNNFTGGGRSFGDGSQKQHDGRKKISLGDYALPPDKMVDRLKGIPRTRSTEYSDPYETQQLLNSLRKESGTNSLRISSPARIEDSDIYSLAKHVPEQQGSENNSPSFRGRTQSEASTRKNTRNLSSKSQTSSEEDYDHLVSWRSDKLLNSPRTPTPKSPSELVYSSKYEDPWDSQTKIKEFHYICEKAETASNRKSSQSSPSYTNKDTPRMDVYEDAWDSGFRQQKLEQQVEEAHRRMSESNIVRKKYDYEEPISSWKRDKSPNQPRPVQRQAALISSSEPAYSSNYEAPWDSKQKELEERFSRAGGVNPKSLRQDPPRSPSSMSPPQFSPPPIPQTYEDAWDIRPQSKVIAQMTSGGHSSPEHKPSSNQGSPAHKAGYHVLAERTGEPIDPMLPLDIQQFYHGGIPRKAAEDLLLIHKEGSYLVRRSETQKNVFSLTLKGVGGISMHLRISISHGEYVLGENSQPFPTVPEMIDYYTRHPLPVQDASHIKLMHPIPRS